MADGADDFVTCDVSRVRLWRTGTARRRRAVAAAAAGIQAGVGPERTASNWFTVLPPRTVFHLPSGSGVIYTVGCKSCGQDRSDRLGSEMSKRWMDQAEAQLLRTQRPKRATVSSSLVAGPPPRGSSPAGASRRWHLPTSRHPATLQEAPLKVRGITAATAPPFLQCSTSSSLLWIEEN